MKQAHISNVEASRRAPSLLFVLQMAQSFQVATDYLLRDTIPTEAAVEYRVTYQFFQSTLPVMFGAKLRHLRLSRNLTQVELAWHLGLVQQAHLSYLESGHHRPSNELVVHVADLFRVSTDYLLWDAIPLNQSDPRSSSDLLSA